MGHCGDRVAALVDGELSHEARDRMLAHLAQCPECRHETDALRRTKALMVGLDTPAPAPRFLSDLLRIAEHGVPGGVPAGGFPLLPRGATIAAGEGGAAENGTARWSGLLSAGAFTLATAVFGSIFVMAFVPSTATSAGDPHVTPPYGQTLVEPALGAVQPNLSRGSAREARTGAARTGTGLTGSTVGAPGAGQAGGGRMGGELAAAYGAASEPVSAAGGAVVGSPDAVRPLTPVSSPLTPDVALFGGGGFRTAALRPAR